MQLHELTGLVLTHQRRDITPVLQDLGKVCGQIIIVNDSRDGRYTGEDPERIAGTEVDVIERAFDTFPAQRNAGIDKALGNWVLSVDSDERLSPAFRRELPVLQPSPNLNAYAIPRVEWFKGRALVHSHPYGTVHQRLFRSHLRYADHPVVHEELSGVQPHEVGLLSGCIEHVPDDTFMQRLRKSFAYGQSSYHGDRKAPYSWKRVAISFPADVIREGFWKDGMPGIAMAAVQTAFRLGAKCT